MKKMIVSLALISAVGGSLIAQQEQALQNLILGIYGDNFDEQAFNRFVADNRQDFVQGGLGDLDKMISQEADDANGRPAVAWASDLHEAVHHQEALGARAFKVLQSLNDFRTNKLSEQDFKLLESPNSRDLYCKDLVMNCLLSSARHAELEDLLQNEQDLKRRKIVPDNFFSIDALVTGLFVGNNTIVDRCPSLKIFPELNRVREKIAPHVDKITDDNKASDDQEIDFVVDNIRNFEWELIPSVVEGILVNSGLDVDVIASQRTSLGKIIDDSKYTADSDVQQDPNSADLQEKARRWTMIQLAARQNRSKKQNDNSWIVPDNDDGQGFINKVIQYIETGNDTFFKNLQNYMIDRDRNVQPKDDFMFHLYGRDNTTLYAFLTCLNVLDSAELLDRVEKVCGLIEGGPLPLHVLPDHGKKVTVELLKAVYYEPRLENLAKVYCKKYPVTLKDVDKRDETLEGYITNAGSDQDGLKRVKAILNPQTNQDSDKGSWSTTQKCALLALVTFAGYIICSQYGSEEDDADTTAVA